MQSVQDCFSKVKSICYKYISSQETKNVFGFQQKLKKENL